MWTSSGFLCALLIAFASTCQFHLWARPPRDVLPDGVAVSSGLLWHVTTPLSYLASLGLYLLFQLGLFALLWLLAALLFDAASPVLPLWIALLQLVLLPRLPLSGRLLNDLCDHLQRSCFTPRVPDPETSAVMEELQRHDCSFRPQLQQLLDVLPAEQANELMTLVYRDQISPRYYFLKFEFLFGLLQRTMAQDSEAMTILRSQRNKLVALAQNQQEQGKCDERSLQQASRYLLLFCYQLLCQRLLEQTGNRDQRLLGFRAFGLLPNVDDSARHRAQRQLSRWMKRVLPSRQASNVSERRSGQRVHCYQRGTLAIGDVQVSSASAIVSPNGVAVYGQTEQPLGCTATFYMEGVGPLEGTIVRKTEHEVCVAFNGDRQARSRLRRHLDMQSQPAWT